MGLAGIYLNVKGREAKGCVEAGAEAKAVKPAAAKPKETKPVIKTYVPVLRSRIRSPKMDPFAVEVIRGVDRENLRFKNFKSEEKA